MTARAVPQLARRYGVEMPICESLHAVLFEGKTAVEAGRELMARAARPERDLGDGTHRLAAASFRRFDSSLEGAD